jgi:hypothetical protein
VNINCTPRELNPQPSFVVIMSSAIFINHWNHLMLFSWCLRHDFLSNHLNNLLSNDIIVQIESLQASNQLARSSDLISDSNCSLIFSIMLE